MYELDWPIYTFRKFVLAITTRPVEIKKILGGTNYE